MCLYFTQITPSSTTFVLIYVGDIIVTCSSSFYITELVQQLSSSFALKDMGVLHYFLGIEVKHIAFGGLLLSQAKYI